MSCSASNLVLELAAIHIHHSGIKWQTKTPYGKKNYIGKYPFEKNVRLYHAHIHIYWYFYTFSTKQDEKPSKLRHVKEICCQLDVWSIIITLILQDGPFISFRLVLVFYYNVVSYMTAFVIAKNAMVITLQVNAFIAIEKNICSVQLILTFL